MHEIRAKLMTVGHPLKVVLATDDQAVPYFDAEIRLRDCLPCVIAEEDSS